MRYLLVLSLLVACSEDAQPEAQPATPEQPAAPTVAPGSLNLTPGFTPDPATVTGSAGGDTDMSDLGEGCIGMFSGSPQHTVTLTQAFPNLRFAVYPTTNLDDQPDLAIAIRKPDGTVICEDDEEDMCPLVSGAFPPGDYQVSVSLLGPGSQPYTLGVSELASFTPRTLRPN